MSFFIRSKGSGAGIPSMRMGTKRKKPTANGKAGNQQKKNKKQKKGKNVTVAANTTTASSSAKSNKKRKVSSLDEEIPSDSDEYDAEEEVRKKGRAKRDFSKITGNEGRIGEGREEEEENDDETAAEKRLRLAKQYLDEIEKQEKEKAEVEAVDRDVIAHRLKEDVLEQAGRLKKKVADEYEAGKAEVIRVLRGHRLPPTCLVLSSDNAFIFSASKDSSIIKWCRTSGKRLKVIPGLTKKQTGKNGHSGQILCLAISTDDRLLASGCRDKVIHIWNPDTMEHIHTFNGHRDVVSGLAFRKGTHQLFSCSHDRTVKVWNLDEMAYVESLFGHQDAICAVDALSRERAISAGGRDNTVRIWKIVEESHLVYNGHSGSIDGVRLINEEYFLSGGDDGLLAVWGVLKKKPLALVKEAHGCSPENGLPNWITSIATLQNTDLIASGSCDGHIRLWKCGEAFRSVLPLFSVQVAGFINGLQFSSDGSLLLAAVGQEHRLGRWWRNKEAKNSICVISLKKKMME